MAKELRVHAELGASKADRWINCTGSVRMERDQPNADTVYTKRGHAAHALAELCFKKGGRPELYAGTMIDGVEVDEDMVESVSVFIDHVRSRMEEDLISVLIIERPFTLAPLNPPAPMFGTPDVIIIQPNLRRIVVADYKDGVGYAVSGKDNAQLRYYGIGAVLELEKEIANLGGIDSVLMEIIQPRAAHPEGIIRGETLAYADIVDFADFLLMKAHEAMDPNAPLTAGPWCRFCRASAICPAQLAQSQAIAQIEFADIEAVPPAPESLPMAVLLEVLEKKDILEKWLASINRFVQGELEAGRSVPGWKLVAKRANRKWKDEGEVKAYLEAKGIPPEEYEDRSLKSPAQIEKVVGKKNLPNDLYHAISSGSTIAPEYDKREAISAGPEHDFPALPPG